MKDAVHITVEEALVLQGFDPSYPVQGNKTQSRHRSPRPSCVCYALLTIGEVAKPTTETEMRDPAATVDAAAPTALPNIASFLSAHLEKKRAEQGGRATAGNATWRASLIGSCLRRQYMELHLEIPPLRQDDVKSLKRFEVGHAWAGIFERWFEEMGMLRASEIERVDTYLDIGSHEDYMIEVAGMKIGVELKSVQSTWFNYRTKEGGARVEHLLQAATSDVIQRRRGIEIPRMVLSVSKDDLQIAQDWVTEEHRQEVLDRLAVLNECKAAGVPPPCTCNHTAAAWQWRWCPYYNGSDDSRFTSKSIKTGEFYANGKAKYRKVFVSDGPCCEVAA
jgi:hypothetical protein